MYLIFKRPRAVFLGPQGVRAATRRRSGMALGLDVSSTAVSGQRIASSLEKQQDLQYCLRRALARSGK